jgi:sialate O-acetylesterase
MFKARLNRFTAFLASALLLCCAEAGAEVKLHPLFADHVVLQQGQSVPVFGTAAPGEEVSLTFRGATAKVTADSSGRWKAVLGSFAAGGPFEMTVKGTNTITLKDVLVGEVWVSSGQSNMAIGVQSCINGPQEAMAARYPQIHVFNVGQAIAHKPQATCFGGWTVCSPGTANEYSAVGYFFARELHKSLKVPVGLINSSLGATPAEAWTGVGGFADPALAHYRKRYENNFATITKALQSYSRDFEAWKTRVLAAAAAGAPVPYLPPLPPQVTDGRQPCGLYNGMIAPLTAFPIRGAIWYQGEGNASRAVEYRTLFPAMIEDWRRQWGEQFPFLFIQLCNYGGPARQPYEAQWAYLREAQTMTLKLPKTAMAVTIDVGEGDIHPRNKQDMGYRLALAARATVYGEDIEYAGPMYTSMEIDGDKIRVQFTHLGGGLTAEPPGSKMIAGDQVKAMQTEDARAAPPADSELKRFEIAGADRKFVWARAKIDGRSVVVWSAHVARPVAVRYAWADNPAGCNLFNKAGLPASAFRTDDWPAPGATN